MIYFFRFAHFLYCAKVPFLPWLLKVINRILFACVLPPSVKVGRNVTFGYQGLGIVVHARAEIGNNVIVGPNVTIGGRSGHLAVPKIGDNVLIGAGARVLGPVVIGRNAQIGANSVVISDVPENAVVVGIPAKVVKYLESGKASGQ